MLQRELFLPPEEPEKIQRQRKTVQILILKAINELALINEAPAKFSRRIRNFKMPGGRLPLLHKCKIN